MSKALVLSMLLLGAAATTIGQNPRITTVSPALKNPTLVITKINPAAVSTNAPIGIYFTFRNDSKINPVVRTGTIAVSIHKEGSDNSPATVAASVFNVKALAIGQSVSGYLVLQTPGKGGEWLVDVKYNEPLATSGGAIQRMRMVTITNAYAVIQVMEDKDADGIDDNTEAALLTRFRPYFMFSNDGGDEDLAPADALWYLTKSELLSTGDENKADNHKVISHTTLVNDPNALIFHDGPLGSSDVVQNPHFSGYHINPIEKLSGEPDNAGRKGEPWDVVMAAKNIGLYGHVVPVKLNNPDSFSFDHIQQDADAGKVYYKIEYWQLFGYNDAHQSYIGNHEGDWASLQLLFDPATNQIVSVFHFAHGVLFRFNMDAARQVNSYSLNSDGMVKEFRGANFTPSLDLAHLGGSLDIVKNKDQILRAQNAILRLLQDPVSKEYCHPVAYISHGTHELFPSEYWNFYGDPNHNGKSYHYLTGDVPNLGEVEWPLTDNSPAVKVVLRYNGYWGTFSRYNSPPEGPPLHKNWTWPGNPNSVSIRSQVGDNGF